jgi:Dolichyl-phosphate-mannose-protein mannosyltransferase
MIKTRLTKDFIFLLIPLILSSYTHLWNPIGFPAIHPDEGVYMRRAMLVMKNLGPYDPAAHFDHPPATSSSSYDHPFFGQIFLAGALALIGYPHSLNPSPDLHSIEMLYIVPRILMGLLAVLDTFLVYKIAEYRHGRNVALFSSVIFAVMPLSWLLRWILLDSILLPFLLASILLAIYIKRRKNLHDVHTNDNNSSSSSIKIPIILLSGILLGLAIYTKIPAFTMIPLVGFLVYTNSNKSLKALGLWFLPVILIPAMWPVYSISAGQFDEWINGVLWQGTQRNDTDTGITDIKINEIFRADPVLLVLGSAGIVICALRKDITYLIWVIPYVLFFVLIGWVILFHWIPILPAFCIGIALAIEKAAHRISKTRVVSNVIQSASILAIVIFGLVSTTMLITSNFSSSEFEAAAFVSGYLQNQSYDNDTQKSHDNGTFLITSPIYSWIFKYVFDRDLVSSHIRDPALNQTEKRILMADGVYQSFISKEDQEDKQQFKQIKNLYEYSPTLARFDTDNNYYKIVKNFYPFTSIIGYSWAKPIVIKANY